MAIFNVILGGGINAKDCTATTGDILNGKTAAVGKEIITGSMQNNGAVNKTLTTQGGSFTIPEGYHDGTGIIKAIIDGLNASNIVSGSTVGGINGSATKIYMATVSPTDRQTIQFTHNLGVIPRYIFCITTSTSTSEIYMVSKTPYAATAKLHYAPRYTTDALADVVTTTSARFSSRSDTGGQTTIYFNEPFVVIAIP